MAEPTSFDDAFGHTVEFTAERWAHVLTEHPELKELEHLVPQVLAEPDILVRSIYDPKVRLYYKWFPALWHGKYLVVVVKFNQRHFLLTAYLTDKVKGGIQLWPSD